MKKLIAWVLLLCMVMGLLCGCASTSSSSGDRSGKRDKEDKVDKDEKVKVTVEETVVYDANDIKVTVTGLNEGYMGQEIKILVENNSEYNIALSGDVFVVNGISVDGWLYTEAAAGKKTKDVITIYTTDLEDAGIENLATVECPDAHIVDSDSYDTLYEAAFSIQTSIADGYEQKIDDSGEVIFQEAGVTVIAKNISDNSMGKRVLLLVKNETGADIIVEGDNVSVNDYTVEAWMYDLVKADTVRFSSLEIYSSSLEENDIEDVEFVTFSIEVRYADSWDVICESEELTVNAD